MSGAFRRARQQVKGARRFALYCVAEIECRAPLNFDLFKIGITTDLAGRLRALQTGNARPLAFIMVEWFSSLSAARAAESAVHQYLASHRKIGEWFSYGQEYLGCPYEAMAVAIPKTPDRIRSDHYFTIGEKDIELRNAPVDGAAP